eukprot:TRINITY_DN2224_c0_g1_i11.p1 TRINITY_DN2224_c0_g1~~TRINITY_DN2224_c0_g1_i11.p1  ORF type:complete len:329 (+),score=75.22 TRINITY_DN2224_c0_g1_i11:1052-2038(+)
MRTAYTPQEVVKDESWDFGVETTSQAQQTISPLPAMHVAWPVSACGELEETSSPESKIEALIQQERLQEALALKEGRAPSATPHAQIADMLAAIKSHRGATAGELFSNTFSHSGLVYSGKESLERGVEMQNKAREWTRSLILSDSTQQTRLGQCWLQTIQGTTQKLRESIDAAVKLADQASMQSGSADEGWRTELAESPQIATFVKAVCEMYEVVLILDQTAQVHPFCLQHCPDKQRKMSQALMAAKPSFSMFQKSMRSMKVEVPDVDINAKLWQTTLTEIGWDSCCALSLVPFAALPDAKVVTWNGRKYLSSVVNCWFHLVSKSVPI